MAARSGGRTSRMQAIRWGWLAAALLLPATAAAEERYRIDPLHTYPNFKVSHLGFSTMHGRFGRTTGTLVLSEDRRSGSVEVVIDAASIDTGFKKRDDHLRSPDFLNAAEFPEIRFRSTEARLGPDGKGTVKGELTIAGVTRPVTLKVTHMHCGINPIDPKKREWRCGFDAEATIRRSDFGVDYALPLIGDELHLELEVEAVRED